MTWTRGLGVLVLGLCSCSADSFVAAGDGGGADGQVDGAMVDGGDAGLTDSHLCSRLSHAPQFCMDFDDGSKTAAFANGMPTMVIPNEVQGGVVKLVPGTTSPLSVLTTTPAALVSTSSPAAAYGPINVHPNALGDFRMLAALYVPTFAMPPTGATQETRLLGVTFTKGGSPSQKQIAAWLSVRPNGKLALSCAQVDGTNPTDYHTVEFANPPSGFLVELDVHLKVGKLAVARNLANGSDVELASFANVTPLFDTPETSTAFFGQVVYPQMPAITAGFDDVVIP